MTESTHQQPATNRNECILVAGGAGYIGSHMVRALLDAGYRTLTFDNLSSGHRDAVSGDFMEGDLADRAALDRAFDRSPIDAVMIFAGSIQVGESVINPALYYRNNVSNVINLLDAALAHGIRRIVFSSTAAIFGEPQQIPIDEQHPSRPLNPYGRSKLMIEDILADYDRAYGLKSVCLRYFNAAGAHPNGDLGERHEPETHLIPIALEVALGMRPHLAIYGDDYDTPDGTCIRDYVHVADLCQAHLLALQTLREGSGSLKVNLGNGQGFSVREVVDAVQRVTGRSIPVQVCERRPGDPARLIADSRLAKKELGWKPQYVDLDEIVATAWAFARARAGSMIQR